VNGASSTFIGQESNGSSSEYHIRIQRRIDPALGLGELDSPCDVFIDSSTYFIDRIVFGVRSPSNLRQILFVTVNYEDYRMVSGLMLPVKATSFIGETLINVNSIRNIKVSSSIDGSLFQIQDVK
jgi:hypothetical protein